MRSINASRDGRYFVDQDGAPVFWLGTTQWELVRRYTLEEARLIAEKTRERGFAFVQVMLLGVGDGNQANVDGHTPWRTTSPLTPDESYFRHVDQVLEIAGSQDLVVVLTVYHQSYRALMPMEAARAWAHWIASRYHELPLLIWSMTPETRPEFAPVMRELVAGLRDGDGGRHLVTMHPDPAPHEPGFLHDEPWLSFRCVQTWKWVDAIVRMVSVEYHLKPTKPVVMAEGAYEEGSEYGFDVTPLWVRRQAWYSYLSGAHHAYGHNASWRVLPSWREALDAPGARQLGLLRKIFLQRNEWWRLVPDQDMLEAGGNTEGTVLTLAARHPEGRWAMVYCATAAAFSVRMGRLAGRRFIGSWVDPRTGGTLPVGETDGAGTRPFRTPDGWEDALLVLDAVD